MDKFSFEEILDTQYKAWETHKDSWAPMEPAYGRASLLWLVEELGEAIHIIKKKGDDEIMNNQTVREEFITEMSDVLMYYSDVLLRYNVTTEELASAYRKKQNKNLTREFNKENHEYLKNGND